LQEHAQTWGGRLTTRHGGRGVDPAGQLDQAIAESVDEAVDGVNVRLTWCGNTGAEFISSERSKRSRVTIQVDRLDR
jgi:hypothetical protein